VYENKQKDDNLPEEKSDISTQRSEILQRITRILLKPPGFCHCRSAGERTPRFKKIEAAVFDRRNRHRRSGLSKLARVKAQNGQASALFPEGEQYH